LAQQKVEIDISDEGEYRVLRPQGDLEGGPFMDSSGLGALMGGVRRMRETGGDLAIACTREQHLKLFTITGFGEGVSIAPTVEEAAKGFRE
jgi:anti-sigma B factor antagonist